MAEAVSLGAIAGAVLFGAAYLAALLVTGRVLWRVWRNDHPTGGNPAMPHKDTEAEPESQG